MSMPAARQIAVPAPEETAPTELSLTLADIADTAAEPSPSPARMLQERLQSSLTDGFEAQEKRWPLYVALPLWFSVSTVLWLGIIGGLMALLHHH